MKSINIPRLLPNLLDEKICNWKIYEMNRSWTFYKNPLMRIVIRRLFQGKDNYILYPFYIFHGSYCLLVFHYVKVY